MSTRRSFLQSALLLPSLFAVDAFAQDDAASAGQSITVIWRGKRVH